MNTQSLAKEKSVLEKDVKDAKESLKMTKKMYKDGKKQMSSSSKDMVKALE
jgi:outer membrane protein TolC